MVWRWRRALGIGRVNEGTKRLYQDYFPEKLPEEVAEIGRRNALAPEVIDRQRKHKAGKPAHPNTRAALLRGAKQPKSAEWKAQLAERNKEARQADGELTYLCWNPVPAFPGHRGNLVVRFFHSAMASLNRSGFIAARFRRKP